jgi:uncharacterized protein YcnI
MRSSAWSSLVISACSALALALAFALALAAPAAAHVSITPKSVSAGSDVDLVIAVPNQSDPRGIVRVTIGVPAELQLDDAELKPGWTQQRAAQAITWTGGPIPKGQFATFGLRGTAPGRGETVLFNVLVGSRSGKTTTYRVALDVRAHASRDVGARNLGKAALFVALAAALLALAGGFLALYVWLRPPPP